MIILALDVASTTGWACGPVGGDPIYGHFALRPGGEWPGRVFSNYRRWLERQIDVLTPRRIYAEDQFMPRSLIVAQRLLGLRAITQMVSDERDIPLRWVPVQSLSGFFTGQGGMRSAAKKVEFMAVARRYGWHPQVSDEADALAVFLWGEHDVAPAAAGRRSAGELFAHAGG